MTNSEKYLKDGVVAKELWETFQAYYYKNKSKESDAGKAFRNFFEEKTQPTLTEDERVILKNIKNVRSIKRDNEGDLVVYKIATGAYYITMYNHLFQFIKERRRIFY